jgi:hypothetical protein
MINWELQCVAVAGRPVPRVARVAPQLAQLSSAARPSFPRGRQGPGREIYTKGYLEASYGFSTLARGLGSLWSLNCFNCLRPLNCLTNPTRISGSMGSGLSVNRIGSLVVSVALYASVYTRQISLMRKK